MKKSEGLKAEEILISAQIVSIADVYDALMDIQMPNMNGYDAARKIRKMKGRNAEIPIIAMTANAFEEDKKNAMEAGMDGHIAKPIEITKLIEVLRDFIPENLK